MTPWEREYKMVNNNRIFANHKYLTKDEMKTTMNEFEKKLKLSVIDIMDRENNNFILTSIQEAFSK